MKFLNHHTPLIMVLLTLFLWAGCGSGYEYNHIGSPGGGVGDGTATTTIRLEQTLLRNTVPSAVTHQRFTGFDSSDTGIYGPETREKANPIILEEVPVAVTRLQIEHLVGDTVIGVANLQVVLVSGETFALTNPEFDIEPDAVESLVVTPPAVLLEVDGTQQYSAVGTFAEGVAEFDITNDVVWTSSAPSIAEVNPATGLVTARSSGTATITATIGDVSASGTLEVTASAIRSLTINPPEALSAPGTTRTYTAVVTFEDNETRDATELVSWNSNNTDVEIGASTGEAVVALGAAVPSTATITATLGDIEQTATLNLGSYAYLIGNSPAQVYRASVNQTTGALENIEGPTAIDNGFDAVVDPSGRFLYVAAGLNIAVFQISPQTGALELIENQPVDVISTYLAVHPSGRFLYSIAAPGSQVTTYSIASQSGELEQIGSLVLSNTFPQFIGDFEIHSSGTRLYASDGPNERLLAATIDATTGIPSLAPEVGTPDEPRELVADPLGRLLLASILIPNLTAPDDLVSIFQTTVATGEITGTNSLVTADAGRNAFDPLGRFVFIQDGPDLSAHQVSPEGVIGPRASLTSTGRLSGLVSDASGRFLYWIDLNIGSLVGVGRINQSTGALENTGTQAIGGSANADVITVTP